MIVEEDFLYIGLEEEVKAFQRSLDFENDEMEKYYNLLSRKHQRCIYDVLKELTEGVEFFGYNFARFLKAFKYTDAKISQLQISRAICKDMKQYLSEDKYSKFSYSGKGEIDINKQLDEGKKTIKLQRETVLFRYVTTICNYFLVDLDLLEKGIGRIQSIQTEWLEEFERDDRFMEIANDEIVGSYNTRSLFQLYEEYLKKEGRIKSSESIFENYWAVIRYSGMFQMLKRQKGKVNEVNAIRKLIKHLYSLQC